MNKRIHKGDKVEIIDSESPYFGKTGTVMEAASVPEQMINRSSKVISSREIIRVVVKLDDTGTTEIFNSKQLG